MSSRPRPGRGSRGARFPVPDECELPTDLRGLFAKARERIGFVPNVFRVYAFRPQHLSAWFAHIASSISPASTCVSPTGR